LEQKGARITKDILNEAQQSMPWLEKVGRDSMIAAICRV